MSNVIPFLSYRKARRDRVLRKMAAMRAAKERKRLARPAPVPAPKRQRWHRLEFGVRDKLTGQTAWHDLKSVRHATIAVRLLVRSEATQLATAARNLEQALNSLEALKQAQIRDTVEFLNLPE